MRINGFKKSPFLNHYFSKKPDWDIATNNFDLKAVRNELENTELEKLQNEMGEEAKCMERENSQRLCDIRRQQLELREKLIDTNDFIQQCNEKELAIEKKIQQEIELQRKLQTEIDRITKDTETLESFEVTLRNAVADLMPYKCVLNQVAAESELFKDPHDLIDRCDTLCKLENV